VKRKRGVRKHTVKAAVDNIDLTKAGSSIRLEIHAAGDKIGTVEIGFGSLRWYGRFQAKAQADPLVQTGRLDGGAMRMLEPDLGLTKALQ